MAHAVSVFGLELGETIGYAPIHVPESECSQCVTRKCPAIS